jgi:hypothetical protein
VVRRQLARSAASPAIRERVSGTVVERQVATGATAPPAAPQPIEWTAPGAGGSALTTSGAAATDVADAVYDLIVDRLERERERRGL